MMFKFKTTPQKTRNLMSKVASGELNNCNFEKKCEEKIKKLTKHEYAKITSSGNNSIFIALNAIKGSIIIPDQGGWHGFKQIAKFLNKEIITLKTDLGLINIDYLDELTIPKNSSLIYTSFAGYTAEQDTKAISDYCKDKNITTIEDASAGIGDKKNRLANGNYSDIIIASTGKPKIINVGSGGLITTNNNEILNESKIPEKLSKTNEIVASGIYEELKNVENKLEHTVNATMHLKKHISNTIHSKKRGINVIIQDEKSKEKIWKIKERLPINEHGFITQCPNYNRIKEKAIVIETKNLDYKCLKKEYLNKIIEVVNNQQ